MKKSLLWLVPAIIILTGAGCSNTKLPAETTSTQIQPTAQTQIQTTSQPQASTTSQAQNEIKATSTVDVDGQIPMVIDNASEEDLRGLHSSIQHTIAGLEYENLIYRFSLIFPKSWGDIKEKVNAGPSGSKVLAVIKLTAQNDGDRYMQIDVVESKYKDSLAVTDAAHVYLKGDAVYSFYWSGGGDYAGMPGMEAQKYDDILKETKTISQTFKMF